MSKNSNDVTRRKFLAGSVAGVAATGLLSANEAAQQQATTRQATGVKVGEVSDTTAIVWMRVTENAAHNAKGMLVKARQYLPKGTDINDLRGACPGAAGRVRLRYATNENLRNAASTAWQDVTAKTDFSHQFALSKLRPATTYYYAAETTGPRGKPVHGVLRGQFKTAPAPDQYADVSFAVVSCTGYRDVDHADGYHIYPAMTKLNPDFYVHTGDNVYYDSDGPIANSVALARHHWHRMHGLPRAVQFHLRTPGYFEKDDHDCYHNDCWPAQERVKRMLPLTYAQALPIFREQIPMGESTYRTVRWGRGVQIWFVEGRDFRSPNNMKDGPQKSIWGARQKKWLLDGLANSNADYKILISPTPIVGPDRKNKRDNHSNTAFRHEGDEFRNWVQKNMNERFFVINGDRHWQYHSVHPQSGVREFCTGAASDPHAGGTPGLNRKIHQFHRVRGGFVSVTFRRRGRGQSLTVQHHDVHGKVVHQHRIK